MEWSLPQGKRRFVFAVHFCCIDVYASLCIGVYHWAGLPPPGVTYLPKEIARCARESENKFWNIAFAGHISPELEIEPPPPPEAKARPQKKGG